MATIELSDEAYSRVRAFRPVLTAVLEEDIGEAECFELVLGRGLDTLLADVIGDSDKDVMLESFRQLAAQQPAAVYGFVARTMETGEEINRDKARKRLGAAPPRSA